MDEIYQEIDVVLPDYRRTGRQFIREMARRDYVLKETNGEKIKMNERELKILIRFAAAFMGLLSLSVIMIAFAELVFDGTLIGVSITQLGVVVGLIGMMAGGTGFSILMFFLTTRKRLTEAQQEMVGNFIDDSLKNKLK